MKSFLVLQHSASEFLGVLESEFERRDIGFEYRRPFAGDAPAGLPGQHDALWLLGGPGSAADGAAHEWVADEIALVRRFVAGSRPVVGLGFGAQVLARAAGGEVLADAAWRGYWTVARATAAGAGDAVARAVDGRRVLVAASGRTILPPGCEPTLVDEHGDWIGAIPMPGTYALLCRPDLRPGTLEDMVLEGVQELPDDIHELIAASRREWPEYVVTIGRLVAGLVAALDLMTERRKRPVFLVRPVGRDGDTSR